MTQMRFLVIAVCILIATTGIAMAQGSGVSLAGRVGGEVDILPAFGVSSSLYLTASVEQLTLVSDTSLHIYPSLSGSESLSLAYVWEPITVGSKLNLELAPLSLDSITAYGDVKMFDITLHDTGLHVTGDTRLDTGLVPGFTAALTGTLTADVSIVSAKSTTRLDLLPFSFSSQEFATTLHLIDITIGNNGPTFTGSISGDFILYPGFAGTTWGIFSTSLNGVTFTSKTTFTIVPFTFSSQFFKAAVTLGQFQTYVTVTLTTASPQMTAGFSYSFP